MLRIAPVDAGEVDVGILAKVNPLWRRAGLRRDGRKFDRRVGLARRRIPLLDHFGTVRIYLVTLLHRHLAFVDAREGDGGIVRRPPIAGVAIHFLVGDEFGDAVADGVAAVGGQLHFRARGQINRPQIARAHEADEAALRRDLRVGGETFAGGELAHRGLARFAQVVQIQFAAEREQQCFAVRRPLVIDDARQRRGALAFAPRLFLVAQHFLAGQHVAGIDQ